MPHSDHTSETHLAEGFSMTLIRLRSLAAFFLLLKLIAAIGVIEKIREIGEQIESVVDTVNVGFRDHIPIRGLPHGV